MRSDDASTVRAVLVALKKVGLSPEAAAGSVGISGSTLRRWDDATRAGKPISRISTPSRVAAWNYLDTVATVSEPQPQRQVADAKRVRDLIDGLLTRTRGRSQKAIAGMLGVDQTTVSRWKRAHRKGGAYPEPEPATVAALERFAAGGSLPGPDFQAGVRVAMSEARKQLTEIELRLISPPVADATAVASVGSRRKSLAAQRTSKRGQAAKRRPREAKRKTS